MDQLERLGARVHRGSYNIITVGSIHVDIDHLSLRGQQECKKLIRDAGWRLPFDADEEPSDGE